MFSERLTMRKLTLAAVTLLVAIGLVWFGKITGDVAEKWMDRGSSSGQ
jgi:hypothetical protein